MVVRPSQPRSAPAGRHLAPSARLTRTVSASGVVGGRSGSPGSSPGPRSPPAAERSSESGLTPRGRAAAGFEGRRQPPLLFPGAGAEANARAQPLVPGASRVISRTLQRHRHQHFLHFLRHRHQQHLAHFTEKHRLNLGNARAGGPGQAVRLQGAGRTRGASSHLVTWSPCCFKKYCWEGKGRQGGSVG